MVVIGIVVFLVVVGLAVFAYIAEIRDDFPD